MQSDPRGKAVVTPMSALEKGGGAPRDAQAGEPADPAARGVRDEGDGTCREDALRVFREARLAAQRDGEIEPQALALYAPTDMTRLSGERVFDEMRGALLDARRPSLFFRALRDMGQLKAFFPELEACIGVGQNLAYHPEGDVFEHTMLVLDCAAALRERAKWPLGFMVAALTHDLGKPVATERQPDGKITSYGHEVKGLELCERQLRRLTRDAKLIEYAKNMMWLHMRPNMLAKSRSKKKKTRQLFDMSVCPEDLILLSRADASGKRDVPYDEANEAFLRERLADYRRVTAQPMVTEADLAAAGIAPGPERAAWLARARQLHFSGLDRRHALRQVLAEARGKGRGDDR